MLREVGRFSSASLFRFVLTAGVRTSMTGESAATVTLSCTESAGICASIVATKPASSRTSTRLTVANPDSSNVSE